MRMWVCSTMPESNRMSRCLARGSTRTTVWPTSLAAGTADTLVRAPVTCLPSSHWASDRAAR
jgi:hypothetical protein